MEDTIILDRQNGCARCDSEYHEAMVYKLLARPIPAPDEDVPYTHWTLCPVRWEPILMQIFPDE